jgi:hypothetical protein
MHWRRRLAYGCGAMLISVERLHSPMRNIARRRGRRATFGREILTTVCLSPRGEPGSCSHLTPTWKQWRASSSPAITTTARPAPATSGSGAKQAAPASSSPARTISCDDHDRPLHSTQCGLPGIDRVPFGMHACHFYRNRDDLIGALAPYFVAGLRANERCSG